MTNHNHWIEQQVPFRYCLSYFCLFRKNLRGRISRLPLELAATSLPEPECPLGEFRNGVDFVGYQDYPITDRLPRLQRNAATIRYALNQVHRYYIDLQGTFEQYLSACSRKTRSTIQRKVRKFADSNAGKLDCRVYRGVNQMLEYHKLARNIAVKTYQEKLFDGGIPEDKKFLSEMQDLAHSDDVRGYILFAGQTPVSYLYLPIAENILRYEYLGYDPGYSSSSPGTVLLYLALESLFQEGRYRYFDFGYGENQTKQVFSTANFLRADIYYFPKTVTNYLTLYSHAGLDSFSVACGRIFDSLHLKQRIKMVMRSKALV